MRPFRFFSLLHLWTLLVAAGCCWGSRSAQAFPEGSWDNSWSGTHTAVPSAGDSTPAGEETIRWTWSDAAADELPNFGRIFKAEPLKGDVVAFWIRAEKPLEKLQVILTGEDGVGAEISLPGLLKIKRLEAKTWYYVVWPYRSNPGWVRYGRSIVDWNKISAISFYTWAEQLHPAVTLQTSPFEDLSFAQVEEIFSKHPERVRGNRSLPWRVLSGQQAERMLPIYLQQRAEAKVAALRAKFPPANFLQHREAIRKAVRQTMLMPPPGGAVQATPYGKGNIDGIKIERQLLKLRDGVYSPAVLFHPPGYSAGKSYPTILMLPGHGDPNWSPGVQSRCLGFAKQGYLVMLVQPFGQDQRGENSLWNEGHDSQEMAYLLTAGQGMLGLIMADHEAEIAYLRSRPDVDARRVIVTGVSMGGTNTIWQMAINPSVYAGVAVAAAHGYQPNNIINPTGLCDLMVGAYNVADQEMLEALAAPRPLAHLYPRDNAAISPEGIRLMNEGWLSYEEAVKKYAMDEAQLTKSHEFPHQVYSLSKAPNNYEHPIIAGPHDYTKPMREWAAGWLEHVSNPMQQANPIPEPLITPLWSEDAPRPRNIEAARAVLTLWPDGKRPSEVLAPLAYVQREISAKIAALPPAPASKTAWQKTRLQIQRAVPQVLGVSLNSPHSIMKVVGQARDVNGPIRKLIVQPEAGIEVPALLFAPDDGCKPNGQMVVLLNPKGMTATAGTAQCRALTKSGAWVLCVDLRGMGETRYTNEQGAYVGWHDFMDVSFSSLKLGETMAGYWSKDLLAAIAGARHVLGAGGKNLRVTVRGERETGLIAILATGQSDTIQAVETEGLLASYFSSKGYGFPFAFGDENGDKGVRARPVGGYGSPIPCIPNMLKHADIAQLAALVAPRPLTIAEPLWASGDALSGAESKKNFAWTEKVYRLENASSALRIVASTASVPKP